MKLSKLAFLALLIGTIFTSCESVDDAVEQEEPLQSYENGIFISGEGSTSVSGSVSFLSNDLSNLENEVYSNVNDELLGNYFQSIGFNGDLAYLVVDSGNIVIVNRSTFEKQEIISTGLVTPRYIAFSGNRGYVTNWGDPNIATDDFIAVINLNSNIVETIIPVDEGPEQVLAKDGKLYVSHKGGFNVNNKISVINVSDDTVNTIIVNDAPDEMIFDASGNLIVLSSGKNLFWEMPPVETEASITKINVSDNSILSNLVFPVGSHPSLMAYENGTIYYILNDELYGFQDIETTLPSTSLLSLDPTSTAPFMYGMSVKNDRLFVTDASFTGQSELLIYDLNLMIKIKTLDVALGASKIYFN